jgi:heme-degrading monooxygenase HmoA
MQVSRHWTGVCRSESADAYIMHLQNDTFKKLAAIDGFVSASILKRDVTEGVEFLIVTEWKNLEAIKKFAGENAETAVVPKVVDDMMLRYDKKVRHYDVQAAIKVSDF